MRFFFPITCLLILITAGCGVEPARQITKFAPTALLPQADTDGWYTFGNTSFKGNLVNGAPDGYGLCVEKNSYSTSPTACTYDKGERVDVEYLKMRDGEITARQDLEREDQERQAAYQARYDEKINQARREADAYMRGVILNLPDQMQNQWNEAEAVSRGSSVEEDAAKAALNADFYERIEKMKADPNSDLNRREREREASHSASNYPKITLTESTYEEEQRERERLVKIEEEKNAIRSKEEGARWEAGQERYNREQRDKDAKIRANDIPCVSIPGGVSCNIQK